MITKPSLIIKYQVKNWEVIFLQHTQIIQINRKSTRGMSRNHSRRTLIFWKVCRKNQRRTIYEVIDQVYSEKNNPFEDFFLEICKTFTNINKNLPKDTKDVIKETFPEGGLYSHVVRIKHYKNLLKKTKLLNLQPKIKQKKGSGCL